MLRFKITEAMVESGLRSVRRQMAEDGHNTDEVDWETARERMRGILEDVSKDMQNASGS